MNRIAALLVVLAAYGLLAVGASAKTVVSKKVTQSRAEVARYWTPERMRNAKPVPVAKGGKPGGGTSTKPGTATQVTFPYGDVTRTNGKVFFTDGRYNYVCSGTALTSQNESVVWTAGHCVNEGPGGFYGNNWTFVPAYHDGTAPHGKFVAQRLFSTSDWVERGDFGDDLGAARVGANQSGATLTDAVGGRYPGFNDTKAEAEARTYDSFGYPAGSPYDGQSLWTCNSPFYMWDTSSTPNTMSIRCSMNGGSSGGGWVSGGQVRSVNSYTYRSLKNVMFGPQQGLTASELFTAAAATPAP